MRTGTPIPWCLTPLACALAVVVAAPAALKAQAAPNAPAASKPAAVRNLPLAAGERQRFVGVYSVTMPDSGQRPISLRLFEENGALMGQINGNTPSRLLYQGNNAFRPEQALSFLMTFTVENGRVTRVSMVSPEAPMAGVRVEEAQSDPSTSGALYDALTRMDSILFNATFVACDLQTINSLLSDDVEFYHDKTGFESGPQVRETFQRLTQSCPHARGITRELLEGSLQVYPIKDYGAVQMGVHRFVEQGAPTTTIAKFVHLWQQKDGAWRLTRVLSLDHRVANLR